MAPLDKTELAVGDSARLEVIFSTGKRSGWVTKSPMIQTTYNDSAYFFVQIRTNVTATPSLTTPLNFSPYRLYFSNSEGTDNDENIASFKIINSSDSQVDVSLVAWPAELITTELPRSVSAHGEANVSAEVKDPDFKESFFKSMTIEANGTDRFTIPLIGRVWQ